MTRHGETTAHRAARAKSAIRKRSRRSSPKPGANCPCLCRQCSYGYHCGPCCADYRAAEATREARVIRDTLGWGPPEKRTRD